MRYILSVVILLSFTFGFTFAAAAEPRQILARARKTMESLPPLAMKVETEISGDMMPAVSRHITEQRWDGKRFDCTLKEERVNRRDKKTQDYWAARKGTTDRAPRRLGPRQRLL